MNTKNGIYGYYDKQKNQMVYVGQSNNIYKRHTNHMKPSKYNEQVINRVLQNNPDRYELVIIKAKSTFSKEDRDILEKHYIQFYNTFFDPNKFNYTLGGDSSPSIIPDIKKKISEAHRGKYHSEEAKRKMSEAKRGKNHPNYGKHLSEETKRKISEAKRGENNHMYGKHHTEEAKRKISEALTGSNHPNYGKFGEDNPLFGKHHSDETKRKMSLSHNTTGYFRVHLKSCPTCKSGKTYCYQYYNDGKQKMITSVNLEKLKKKVLEKGLPWEKLN